MDPQESGVLESLVTGPTLVGLEVAVTLHVSHQAAVLREGCTTDLATVLFQPRVDRRMTF